MDLQLNGKHIHTDNQGYIDNPNDWSEDFAEAMAQHDGITLFDDHWGLILYFREYYEETHTTPTMNRLVRSLGQRRGHKHRNAREYRNFLYKLFPRDPIRELCKLAGLPKPEPDS